MFKVYGLQRYKKSYSNSSPPLFHRLTMLNNTILRGTKRSVENTFCMCHDLSSEKMRKYSWTAMGML